MTSSSECGCLKGTALYFKSLLADTDAPTCPNHPAETPVETSAVNGGGAGSPLALNDTDGLVAAIGAAFGHPVNHTSNF